MRIRVNVMERRGSGERGTEKEMTTKNQQNVTNNKLLCVQLESLFFSQFLSIYNRLLLSYTYGKRTKSEKCILFSATHSTNLSNQINNFYHVE